MDGGRNLVSAAIGEVGASDRYVGKKDKSQQATALRPQIAASQRSPAHLQASQDPRQDSQCQLQ